MAQLLGIKKVPPTPVEIDYIDLRLSGDEADALYDILCVVGGNPTKSRRGYTAKIFEVLRLAYPGRNCQRPPDVDGRLYFLGE